MAAAADLAPIVSPMALHARVRMAQASRVPRKSLQQVAPATTGDDCRLRSNLIQQGVGLREVAIRRSLDQERKGESCLSFIDVDDRQMVHSLLPAGRGDELRSDGTLVHAARHADARTGADSVLVAVAGVHRSVAVSQLDCALPRRRLRSSRWWRRCSPPCCFRRGRPGGTSGAPAACPAGCQARRRRRSPAERRLKYSRSRRSEEGGGTPIADCGARSRARVHPEGPLEAIARGPPWPQRCRRALLGEGGRCVVASRAFQVEPSISGAALAPLDHAYSASRYATMSSDSYSARSVFGSIR